MKLKNAAVTLSRNIKLAMSQFSYGKNKELALYNLF